MSPEGGREGGRGKEGGRKGREEREGGGEGGRKEGMEGGREGGKRGRKAGREGGKRGRKAGRERGRERLIHQTPLSLFISRSTPPLIDMGLKVRHGSSCSRCSVSLFLTSLSLAVFHSGCKFWRG